jgi:MinD-like ATPase involved in chromosome partitioning or flagellar assembly
MIISIFSNKGGVGKTTIAIIMGMLCSRKLMKKTLLLELDSSPGDFGILFDIEPNKTLDTILRFPQKFKICKKRIFENLDVVSGVPDPIIAEEIKESDISNLINNISGEYDFIIVDTQTVINGSVLDVLKRSDIIFLITDSCMESIFRISKIIEVITEKFLIPKSKIKIIINKKTLFNFFRIWDIKKIIEIPIETFISFDRNFNKSFFLFNKNKVLKSKIYKEIGYLMDALNKKGSLSIGKLKEAEINNLSANEAVNEEKKGAGEFEFERQVE